MVDWVYDFPSFFNNFDFLNQSKAAKYMGMSPSNFRHYAAGSKRMSQKQFIKVREGFKKMANELKESTLTM
ncbi:MAG: hypothetical protein PHC39_13255 [Proteiniphilum sp.]|nr:hypothetical protein [Proteiniphilum sp.]